jgi:hypothetical protein
VKTYRNGRLWFFLQRFCGVFVHFNHLWGMHNLYLVTGQVERGYLLLIANGNNNSVGDRLLQIK